MNILGPHALISPVRTGAGMGWGSGQDYRLSGQRALLAWGGQTDYPWAYIPGSLGHEVFLSLSLTTWKTDW